MMIPSCHQLHRSAPLYEVKAGLFKGLSHPLRIRILELLSMQSERTVADLQSETGLEASHLSQHLSVLRRHRLVESDRRGSHVYYHLAYPEVADLLAIARGLLLQHRRRGRRAGYGCGIAARPRVERVTRAGQYVARSAALGR